MTQKTTDQFTAAQNTPDNGKLEGYLLEAEIVDTYTEEDGMTISRMEFGIKPELAPERVTGQEYITPAKAEVEFLTEEGPEQTFHALEAGMIYMYSQYGLASAGLVRKKAGLCVIPSSDAKTRVDTALEDVARIFNIVRNITGQGWDKEFLFSTFHLFEESMDLGTAAWDADHNVMEILCQKMAEADVDALEKEADAAARSDVAQRADAAMRAEDDEELEADGADMDTPAVAVAVDGRPEVESLPGRIRITCNEEQGGFVLETQLRIPGDDPGEEPLTGYKEYTLDSQGVWDAMEDMVTAAEHINILARQMWSQIAGVYTYMTTPVDMDGIVQDLVPRHHEEILKDAARAEFEAMDVSDAPVMN